MPDIEIRYLRREQIDVAKWDLCIDMSWNGMIYGYSFYLDRMAKNWDALILGDYDAIMPVTWNIKWGIKYLYQPPFTQQLGIFSPNEISMTLISSFLEVLIFHFRFGEIFLNHGNSYHLFKRCSNFILPLGSRYNDIYSNYKGDAVRNLRRSGKFGLIYDKDVQLKTALNAYRTEYAMRMPHLERSDFTRFEMLCTEAKQNDQLILRAILDSKKYLLAVAILLKKNTRLYLIQSTTFKEGRRVEANYHLIDEVIQEFAGTDSLLDFEGSDIPGIAYFYKNFGSVDQPYFFYRFNHLPFVIRWMKPAS